MEVKVKDITNRLSILHMVMEALYNKIKEFKVKDNLLPPLNNRRQIFDIFGLMKYKKIYRKSISSFKNILTRNKLWW